jgi:hypothetical protein
MNTILAEGYLRSDLDAVAEPKGAEGAGRRTTNCTGTLGCADLGCTSWQRDIYLDRYW